MDTTQHVGGALHQVGMGVEVVEIHAHGLVGSPGQGLDQRPHLGLPQVDRADTGAHVGEGPRSGFADPLRRSGHDDSAALQPPAIAATLHASTSQSISAARGLSHP